MYLFTLLYICLFSLGCHFYSQGLTLIRFTAFIPFLFSLLQVFASSSVPFVGLCDRLTTFHCLCVLIFVFSVCWANFFFF